LEVLHGNQAQGMKFFDLLVEMEEKPVLNKGPRMDGGTLGTMLMITQRAKHQAYDWPRSWHLITD
jgi:hypothetical protein